MSTSKSETPVYLDEINGLGELYLSKGIFSKQSSDFKRIKAEYMGIRDIAYARLNTPRNASRYTGKASELKSLNHLIDGRVRTCHSQILSGHSPGILARISPLFTHPEMAKSAVEANIDGDFFLTSPTTYNEWFEIAEQDKRKRFGNRRAIFLPEIKEEKLGIDSNIVRFLFQDTAEEYFNQFAPTGRITYHQIPEFLITPEELKEKTLISQLQLGNIRTSSLIANLPTLFCEETALGKK